MQQPAPDRTPDRTPVETTSADVPLPGLPGLESPDVPFVSEGMRSEIVTTGRAIDPSTGRAVVASGTGYRFEGA
jgi:hypothetical protein